MNEFEVLKNHNNLSKEEAIRRIEQVYQAKYNPDLADFDAYEQLLVCESLAETEAEELEKYGRTNEDANVKWNGNGTYKQNANFELTESKLNVITELKTLTYITPPIKIASLLQTLFAEYNSRDGHWLYIAQHWNPRTINRVINYIVKVYENGTRSIQNPAKYFTYLIKRRKERRSL